MQDSKIVNATKWSMMAEVLSKLVTPVSSMILARLLSPSAFGAIATIAMVNAFADIFADAGFQKYIIQHEFETEEEKQKTITVSFWSNITIGCFLWLILIAFRKQIAILVGSPELDNAFIVAGISIPLVAGYGLLSSLFKRNLDFKTLFTVRMISVCIPLAITIPLAFLLKNYWALIFGTIFINISNFLVLFIKSEWRPSLFFDFGILKKILSFSIWVLLDAIMAWFAGYLDIFLIGIRLSEHQLGLYKTSTTLVSQIFAIVSSTILPVMLPALSRCQNNIPSMKRHLLLFQKYTGLIILPIGCVTFLYSDLITSVILGSQWLEASEFIGLWALTQVLIMLFSRFCTVIYPSIGKPQFSTYSQIIYLSVLIPAIIISSSLGFRPLYITACLVRLWAIAVDFIFVFYLIKLSPLKMTSNLKYELTALAVSIFPSLMILKFTDNIVWQIIGIMCFFTVYLSVLFFIPEEKKIMVSLYHEIKSNVLKVK